MFKNTASQKITVFGFTTATNVAKTGDAANISCYLSKDDGTYTVLGTNTATEVDATHAPGYYTFPLAQAETNADKLAFGVTSTTAGTAYIAVPAVVYTVPANFTATSINASGQVDIAKILGTTISTPATAGILDVNVKNINNVVAATPGASGGILISGTNAGTTTLGALTITGNMLLSAGLTINQSTSNASAVAITGNGTGHGIISTSGSGVTGDGIKAISAATNGNGMTLTKTGSGSDLNATVTPLVLAKTTNITGFNDIAASAIVSSGAITTSGGAVSTVTTVTNQLTAAAIATGVWQDTTAGDFTVASSIGKSLYTTGNAPGAASGLALVGSNMGSASSVTAGVTVTTNNDKTGYSLTQTFPTNFSSLGISAGGHILNVDTLTTYTGNTPQTGDSYARLGAPVTASISADIAAIQTDTTNIRLKYKKNTAHTNFQFTMQDSTTGADKTGLTVAGQVAIDGGAFAGLTNAVTEIANGWYKVNLAAADLNGTNIALRFTSAGAVTKDFSIVTQS